MTKLHSIIYIRTLISRAQSLKYKGHNSFNMHGLAIPASKHFVETLRQFVLNQIQPQQQHNNHISELAFMNGGFVPIGEVKFGSSRHMGILFKVITIRIRNYVIYPYHCISLIFTHDLAIMSYHLLFHFNIL